MGSFLKPLLKKVTPLVGSRMLWRFKVIGIQGKSSKWKTPEQRGAIFYVGIGSKAQGAAYLSI